MPNYKVQQISSGSFTMADLNSFLSHKEILSKAQEN